MTLLGTVTLPRFKDASVLMLLKQLELATSNYFPGVAEQLVGSADGR